MENSKGQEWKEIKLNELFNEDDILNMYHLIIQNKLSELKGLLISKRQELESKGVLPEYLYYYLQSIKDKLRGEN